MDAVKFGDNAEPWSVARGGVKQWLHCRIVDVDALADAKRSELDGWLAERGVGNDGWLLVTRDGHGNHKLHHGKGTADVELSELPVWLQRPEPATKPAKVAKARK